MSDGYLTRLMSVRASSWQILTTGQSDCFASCEFLLQTSKADRQGLLAAIHPHACDSLDAVAEEALLAVKGILECSTSDAKELADDSGTHEALHSMKRELKSHLNSVAHVESYVVDNLQCQRDLLQLCTAIDSMPSLQEGSGTKLSKSSGHEEL